MANSAMNFPHQGRCLIQTQLVEMAHLNFDQDVPSSFFIQNLINEYAWWQLRN
jgi:hypothetical protein